MNENDPEALFMDAEAEVASNHYQVAIDKFKIVKNKFPYSKFAAEALLRIADVYFLQESFLEAAMSYESFRDLHPKHEKAPYAAFRIGKSYFMDSPTNVSKDLGSVQKALAAYSEFVTKNPGSPYLDEAKADIARTREILANKELYIGDYYFKRGHTGSAGPRYRKLIELYPETSAASTARKKLARIMGEGTGGANGDAANGDANDE